MSYPLDTSPLNASPAPHFRPKACVFGCSGPTLTDQERQFFAKAQPLGFILFARNVETPTQLRALTSQLRETVGRPDAPILIDQEGGRVARLGPPHWLRYPSAAKVASLKGPEAAEAAYLVGRMIGQDCLSVGIDVVCAPVLDVLATGIATQVIGDRSYSNNPEIVAALGRAMADGLTDAGVLPVIKHIPGHGRARVDSHEALPLVETVRASLDTSDFHPFRVLANQPIAMTAHVAYLELDGTTPASFSASIIENTIRGAIGFDGFLLSDDLCMHALTGPMAIRVEQALAAGCDGVLHCNGNMVEMRDVALVTPPLSDAAFERWSRIERRPPQPLEISRAAARLQQLGAQA